MHQNNIAVLSLLALAPLLFTTISGQSTLLEKRLWDFGHVPFFMLLSYAFLPYVKHNIQRSKRPLLVVVQVSFFIIIMAAGVELVQLAVGRTASFSDLRKDILGIIITFQAYLLLTGVLDKKWKLSWLFTVLWCLFELYPVSESVLDRWRVVESIPNLATFETKTELLRWNKGVYERIASKALALPNIIAQHPEEIKNHVLKIALNTNHYTGIVADGLFRDWSGYKALQFDIYNPNDFLLHLNVKVEDEAAMVRGSMTHGNRYNGIYKLTSGFNRIQVSLQEIANGPSERKMDLSAIHRLSLFFSHLSESSFIYLDDVTLIK